MNNPYFPAMQHVGERIMQAPHVLLGINFDGTLTPLVEDPDKAILSPAKRQLLRALAGREDVMLTIVSGRSQADLQKRISTPGVVYAANHGLEISGPDFQFIQPIAAECSDTLRTLAAHLTVQLGHISGLLVEDKGFTLSIHYRQVSAADREEIWKTVHAAVTEVADLFVARTGNKVYEILPRTAWNKGTALKWLKDRLGLPETLVIYLADDPMDEDAFVTLADEVTIKIGDSAETVAHYLMAGPAEVQSFLGWVDQLLQEKHCTVVT